MARLFMAFLPLWQRASKFVAPAGMSSQTRLRSCQIALTARRTGPAERHAGSNRLHRLEMDLALALVVASIDERHRSFHKLHDGHVTGRADLKTAELGCAVDHGGRFDGRHGDRLLEREAESHELAHDPGQIRHARRIAGEDVNVGGNGVGRAALLDGGCGYRIVEAPSTMADV